MLPLRREQMQEKELHQATKKRSGQLARQAAPSAFPLTGIKRVSGLVQPGFDPKVTFTSNCRPSRSTVSVTTAPTLRWNNMLVNE